MKVQVYTIKESILKKAGTEDISDALFSCEWNEGLVHQVIVSKAQAQRAGTYATKGRSDKRGGGKKPWRQKGTGRARAGTTRSPIWVGGGHTFAREPYDYSKGIKINKKMYRKAIHVILSRHIQEGSLVVVDSLNLQDHKTKSMQQLSSTLEMPKGLILVTDVSKNLYLASRNIHGLDVTELDGTTPSELLQASKLVVTVEALRSYQEKYAA